ncbi:hypothetical protein ACFU99_00605 [Streptomyces sp. NPDC057654]|uniref:hypothetical protein n=1 Tax=Streptomyces sp. NPDC057654 TaxID=3346196 RepID=UPI0036A85AC8
MLEMWIVRSKGKTGAKIAMEAIRVAVRHDLPVTLVNAHDDDGEPTTRDTTTLLHDGHAVYQAIGRNDTSDLNFFIKEYQ